MLITKGTLIDRDNGKVGMLQEQVQTLKTYEKEEESIMPFGCVPALKTATWRTRAGVRNGPEV